jgi:hypothetical protein
MVRTMPASISRDKWPGESAKRRSRIMIETPFVIFDYLMDRQWLPGLNIIIIVVSLWTAYHGALCCTGHQESYRNGYPRTAEIRNWTLVPAGCQFLISCRCAISLAIVRRESGLITSRGNQSAHHIFVTPLYTPANKRTSRRHGIHLAPASERQTAACPPLRGQHEAVCT